MWLFFLQLLLAIPAAASVVVRDSEAIYWLALAGAVLGILWWTVEGPAPDINAFARKIALAIDEQVWELPDGEACLARIREAAEEMAAAYG